VSSARVPTSGLLGNSHFVTRRFGDSSRRHTAASVVIPALSSKSILGNKESNEVDLSNNAKADAPVSSSLDLDQPAKEETKASNNIVSNNTKIKRVAVPTEIEKLIKEAKDVNTLLNLASSVTGLKTNCQFLYALGQLVKNGKAPDLDLESLQKDPRFTRISKHVRKASYTSAPPLILVALQVILNNT